MIDIINNFIVNQKIHLQNLIAFDTDNIRYRIIRMIFDHGPPPNAGRTRVPAEIKTFMNELKKPILGKKKIGGIWKFQTIHDTTTLFKRHV